MSHAVKDEVNSHCARCGTRITRWFEAPILVRGMRVCRHACAKFLEAAYEQRNCWGCGDSFERVEMDEIVSCALKGRHTTTTRYFCDDVCVRSLGREMADYPVDYDQQDRNAAAAERIFNHFAER